MVFHSVPRRSSTIRNCNSPFLEVSLLDILVRICISPASRTDVPVENFLALWSMWALRLRVGATTWRHILEMRMKTVLHSEFVKSGGSFWLLWHVLASDSPRIPRPSEVHLARCHSRSTPHHSPWLPLPNMNSIVPRVVHAQ